MTEIPDEELSAEAAEQLGEEADPEEFETDEAAAVSEETGTVYDPTGEPELTPHDLEPDAEEA